MVLNKRKVLRVSRPSLRYIPSWRSPFYINVRRSSMKKIEAVVRPHKMDDVREALLDAGIKGMTIIEVRGIGRQKGHTEMYRGSEYHIGFLPKMKFEVVVPDALLDVALQTILKTAKTGEIGDGKIFVSTIDEVIRVRTEESGDSAL